MVQRVILFRGKKLGTGEWIEGSAFFEYNPIFPCLGLTHCIRDLGNEYHFVEPETVGQYVCRVAENYERVFEGDIIKVSFESDGEYIEDIFEVVYSDEKAAFVLRDSQEHEDEMLSQELFHEYKAKVIGNRWDGIEK